MSLAKAKNEIKSAGDAINAELHTRIDQRVVETALCAPQDDTKAMLLGKALQYLSRAFDCLVRAGKID